MPAVGGGSEGDGFEGFAGELLVAVRAFFRWATKQNRILYNPASELELPRLERRLPKHVLTVSEAEQVLSTPDVATPRSGSLTKGNAWRQAGFPKFIQLAPESAFVGRPWRCLFAGSSADDRRDMVDDDRLWLTIEVQSKLDPGEPKNHRAVLVTLDDPSSGRVDLIGAEGWPGPGEGLEDLQGFGLGEERNDRRPCLVEFGREGLCEDGGPHSGWVSDDQPPPIEWHAQGVDKRSSPSASDRRAAESAAFSSGSRRRRIDSSRSVWSRPESSGSPPATN